MPPRQSVLAYPVHSTLFVTFMFSSCPTIYAQGVVSGAVAERLGGYGSLCCLGTGGKAAPLSALGQMNLSPQHKGIVSATQLADMLAAAQVRAWLVECTY